MDAPRRMQEPAWRRVAWRDDYADVIAAIWRKLVN